MDGWMDGWMCTKLWSFTLIKTFVTQRLLEHMFLYYVPIYISIVLQIVTILPHYRTNVIAFWYCQISPIFCPNFLVSYQLQKTPSTVCSLHDHLNLAHSWDGEFLLCLGVWVICKIMWHILWNFILGN
jgi:hypothetical protein